MDAAKVAEARAAFDESIELGRRALAARKRVVVLLARGDDEDEIDTVYEAVYAGWYEEEAPDVAFAQMLSLLDIEALLLPLAKDVGRG